MPPGRFAAHTPRDSLRASLRPGARLTRRARTTRLGLNQKSRDDSRPGSVLGLLRRGLEKTNACIQVRLARSASQTSLATLCSVSSRSTLQPLLKTRVRSIQIIQNEIS